MFQETQLISDRFEPWVVDVTFLGLVENLLSLVEFVEIDMDECQIGIDKTVLGFKLKC
jgi:hypothetical protein